MRTSKQVIVLRKDLNMRKGKFVSQGAHAAVKALLDIGTIVPDESGSRTLTIPIGKNTSIEDWLLGAFTKITVYVNSEQELMEIYGKAVKAKLPAALITDAGRTEFNGVPTRTGCCIGPAWSDEIDDITASLPLL